MRYSNLQHYMTRLSTVPFAVAGLVAIALPSQPAAAASIDTSIFQRNIYELCAARLLRVGIAGPEVAAACAEMLRPQDMATCVVRISDRTEVTPQEALSTCRQVRRPLELATCVVDISRNTKDVIKEQVLSNCRVSLLPTRFSQCVVGLSRRIDLNSSQAMNTCISARETPIDFLPTFIPQDQEPIFPSLPQSTDPILPDLPEVPPANLQSPTLQP